MRSNKDRFWLVKDIAIFALCKIYTIVVAAISIIQKRTYTKLYTKLKEPLLIHKKTKYLHWVVWILFIYTTYLSTREPSLSHTISLIILGLCVFLLKDYDTGNHRHWWKIFKAWLKRLLDKSDQIES